jgi:hypothetical protein
MERLKREPRIIIYGSGSHRDFTHRELRCFFTVTPMASPKRTMCNLALRVTRSDLVGLW